MVVQSGRPVRLTEFVGLNSAIEVDVTFAERLLIAPTLFFICLRLRVASGLAANVRFGRMFGDESLHCRL